MYRLDCVYLPRMQSYFLPLQLTISPRDPSPSRHPFFRVGETVVEERLSLSCCSRGREAKQAAMAGDLLLTSFDKSSEAIHTAVAAVGWVRDPASPGHAFVTDVSQHQRPLTRMFFCVYVWLKKQNNHVKNKKW